MAILIKISTYHLLVVTSKLACFQTPLFENHVSLKLCPFMSSQYSFLLQLCKLQISWETYAHKDKHRVVFSELKKSWLFRNTPFTDGLVLTRQYQNVSKFKIFNRRYIQVYLMLFKSVPDWVVLRFILYLCWSEWCINTITNTLEMSCLILDCLLVGVAAAP